MRKVLLCFVVAVPAMSFGAILQANQTANNGTGGIFMDLTTNANGISVFRFDTIFANAAGGAVQVQVWTRPGTYVGFQGSNAGWTLHETANAISAGSTAMAAVNLTSNILIGGSSTTAVYLHSITTGAGIRYFGTGTTSNTTFTNADLTLVSAHSRTGAVAFAGSLFTPRALSGNVHYEVVPEPATMAALGIGALALVRRRRKS